ncbi:MAG: hypothetical protein BMS9Abin06_0992 [Gammaproteobacteria bacterium]|nr:MAG: hypothetical protein BMS9Abin06_0992 [Gammaproteobacteria bacterium]
MTIYEFSVSPDHPSLPGHFPGNPIVPGVVLLDEVIKAAETTYGDSGHVTAVPMAKFLQPLAPRQLCRIDFSRQGGGHIRFVCSTQGETIATGLLYCEPHTD